ncbi:MAG: hypothetical protein K0B02_01960 [DPANN group archaeon]|nr:hypothetical protein [DPANN group archaeon]
MDAIIRTATRVLFPVILLFGIYISVNGHITPGGGFPAGVILGTAFLLLAIGADETSIDARISKKNVMYLKGSFAIFLLLIVIEGYIIRNNILKTQDFFEIWSGGFTFFLNIIGGFMVLLGILIIVYSFIMTMYPPREDDWK